MMLKEIIKNVENRMEEDVKQIVGIEKIDFLDIFPKSEEHRKQLDEEISKIAKLVDCTEKGNFYLLNQGMETKWGELKFLKVRFFDESRLEYAAAPDFAVKDWEKLKQKTEIDERFSYISREKWDAVEFKTEKSLVYFLRPLVSEFYGVE